MKKMLFIALCLTSHFSFSQVNNGSTTVEETGTIEVTEFSNSLPMALPTEEEIKVKEITAKKLKTAQKSFNVLYNLCLEYKDQLEKKPEVINADESIDIIGVSKSPKGKGEIYTAMCKVRITITD